jgi:sugar transferase (PEP-CTERM system associated)
MVRLFKVYLPVRTLLLFGGEAIVIWASFVIAAVLHFGTDSMLVLEYENGFYKILAITGLALLCLYYLDLYDLRRLRSQADIYFRILLMLGTLSFLLAGLSLLMPSFSLGGSVFLTGLTILTVGLLSWRVAYVWALKKPYFRERVYILGSGDRADKLVQALRTRTELGIEVIGWAGAIGNGSLTREVLGDLVSKLKSNRAVDRVIVAMADRRGKMPVKELLDLRLSDVKVEDATRLIEQISGTIDVDELHPSWLIFSDGFRLNPASILGRRIMSTLLSVTLLLIVSPLLPLVALAVKLSSPGPILYRQRRVGRNGSIFYCYKFRTMNQNAEASTGATWATDDDPRITRVGKFLRKCRFDELPQLWNVLKGDMSFVGPRPERPEFVQMLEQEIPYYGIRHVVRPGITGWAQVNYPYGASVADAKEKLKYDLYHIKNMSLGLDFFIVFQTIKIVLFGRGAK